MKKNLLPIIVIVMALLVGSAPAWGDAADDYKVIKNAFKGKKGSINFFKISVYDKAKKKETVKITLPLTLVEIIANCDDGKKATKKISDDCDFDLKEILAALKKNGPTTLVEVDEEDCLVKIWFE